MDFLIGLHSGIRWLVVVVWVVLVLRYLLAWALNPRYRPFDRYLYTVFSGLLDFNVAIGLLLLILNILEGTSDVIYWFHMGVMLFAAVTAHLASRHIKTLLDNEPKEKFFIGWASALFIGVLVAVGVALVGGWVS
ncbi:MAG: hypothetical protein M9918_10765 [Anaerolineae bacterium]|nr:hypothetical protein [Anaerolineae bacterium]MCO5188662.1 hypothetical protein [Anaerolineae bacterium]MCO5195867.1 hypothetical protein [Anaerolineae bacterium]